MATDPNDVWNPKDVIVETSAINAPLIYADNLFHCAWIGGVAKLAFVQNMADADQVGSDLKPGWHGRHAVVVTMPIPALVSAIRYLNALLPILDPQAGTEAPVSTSNDQ